MQDQTLQIPVAQIGGHVGIELGTKLVKDYFDAYPEQAYGNVVGKDILQKILAQPGCEGLAIYPALNEEGKRTVVYAGVDAEGKIIERIPVVDATGAIRFKEGIVADFGGVFPCPDDGCGGW
jgi:hypothetical protein